MSQGNVQPQELTQAMRFVEKRLPPSSIPPPHPDEILYVECHPDPETHKPVVLWDDILQAFDGAVQVRHKAKVVPFLKGKDLRILEPHRIAMMADTVLDVVVGSKEVLSPSSVSEGTVPSLLREDKNMDRKDGAPQDNTINTTSPVRRNPVYGLVETAMKNYTHIDNPLAFPSSRGPHATLDNRPTTIKNPAVHPQSGNNSNSQLQGLQSATINVPMERDVVQLSISASQGDKNAQVALGDMYRDGEGVPQDYQAAMDWYLKAVEQGDAAGQQRVGNLYGEGLGVPRNYSTAMNWYLKAAEQGYAGAQHNIGLLYYYGRGVPQDPTQAMDWMLKAAEGGHARSQDGIGQFYYFGRGVRQDYEKAMVWFLKAAQQGYVNSQFTIGVLYHHGRGVPQDHGRAKEWYLKAADKGHAGSQYNIGDFYLVGKGVRKDYAQAMEWYLKAANQGHALAQNSIGLLYYHGQGVPENYAQARDWYLKAANQGHVTSQFNIGVLYRNGQGVPQDYKKAAEWFTKAAKSGDSGAKRALDALKVKGVVVN